MSTTPEKVNVSTEMRSASFAMGDQWTRGQYWIFLVLNLLPMVLVWLYPLKTWAEMYWFKPGNLFFILVWLPAILVFLIGPAWAIAGVVLLFWRRHFKRGIMMVICAVGWGASLMAARHINDDIRMARFMQAGVDAKPLIAAIEQFVSENGEPPHRLSALVPKYFAAVPGTGIPAYPEFQYRHESWTPPNEWELTISAARGMNFDMYLYLPEGNYPSKGYGGELKPHGEWAYVFE